ncbi:MAG: hypothetical protein DRN71_04315 [Candidatus Nanohalarchaeota archaeon]|nr:MAG: hypothetical protein DRN71_04315 [Candidatus Nanohaloarchaeota archaeon]
MASGIYDFIFYTLLKYGYASSVLTGELTHDIIYGLLIPTIFIAIVVHQAVYRIFGDSSKFIGYLSSITALGVIITMGWVPLIAGIGGFVFVILIALYFIYAFYRRIVSEGHEKMVYDAAGKLGGRIDLGNVTISKRRKRELATELKSFDEQYNDACSIIQNQIDTANNNGIHINTTDANNMDESKSAEQLDERTRTELRLQSQIKRNALVNGEKIVDEIPWNQRIKFIEHYTDDRGKFQKELKELFVVKNKQAKE